MRKNVSVVSADIEMGFPTEETINTKVNDHRHLGQFTFFIVSCTNIPQT